MRINLNIPSLLRGSRGLVDAVPRDETDPVCGRILAGLAELMADNICARDQQAVFEGVPPDRPRRQAGPLLRLDVEVADVILHGREEAMREAASLAALALWREPSRGSAERWSAAVVEALGEILANRLPPAEQKAALEESIRAHGLDRRKTTRRGTDGPPARADNSPLMTQGAMS